MGTPIEHHENYRAIVFPSMSRGNIPSIEPYSGRLDFSAKSLALSKVQQNCTTINSFGRGIFWPHDCFSNIASYFQSPQWHARTVLDPEMPDLRGARPGT